MSTSNQFMTTEYERVVRSHIQPRHLLIQRGGTGGGGLANISSSRSIVSRSFNPVGASTVLAGGAVTSVTDQRKQEKREMQDLNERFAGYIEKVRFLEAQNRKLGDELEALKARWGKQTTIIKSMYQADLDQVKKLLEESEKETQRLQIQVASLEEKVDETRRKLEEAQHAVDESRDKLEKQIQQIAEIESEVHLLRLRSDLLDGDKKYHKMIIARLQDSLNRSRSDYDAQVAEHDAAEARRLALEEELKFLQELHEQELRELAAKAYFDSTASNREYWKSEMSSELKRLQEEYGEKIDELQNEMSLNYNMQIQSLNLPKVQPVGSSRDETIRLRSQTNELRMKIKELEDRNSLIMREIEDLKHDKELREAELEKDIEQLRIDVTTLRAEMEAINRELENLMDAKLGLEKEIHAYRKLLEGESNEEGLKQVVDNMFDSLVSANQSSFSHSFLGGVFNANTSASAGGAGMGGGAGFHSGGGGSAAVGGGGSGFGEYNASYSSSSKIGGGSSSVIGGRTSFQRSAKGPVSIAECSPDGKFIVLENTGKRKEDLGGFTMKRNVDGKEMPVYSFKSDAIIEPHNKIKLWAKGQKPSNATASDIETDIMNWGTGQNITTQLFNSAGQDRASHIQKTLAG
ncbi:hypothetical protein HELRODRAFT_154543 [Helobdella robusta]|uniref:IF rod domain-containing protein n=2 Tax=Helobdella TaxID=6411 RepID=T1ELF0_HELRO|nr:hypothetical protein HELRODRAFT_154543 [Helobdella robusta]ESO08971.1 hypothetical protein HELRODRAFT_154543 [Helobdella robusta]